MPARQVVVIGAPLDLGAAHRRGVDMGPSAIRYAGLAERLAELDMDVRDRGDVATTIRENADPGDRNARYLDAILDSAERVAGAVAQAVREGHLPIVLGGDHSVAIGTLGGLAAARGPGAAIWLDAHADLNTPETTPSGNVHGMPLAAALGLGGSRFDRPSWTRPFVRLEQVTLIGARSVDPGERELIRERGIAAHPMSEIDRLGVAAVVEDALDRARGAAFVHVSLDLDLLDPAEAPGVGTPVRGGLSYREAHLALELIAEAGVVDSLELVEVNPILDERNTTARLAVELAASALGARTL